MTVPLIIFIAVTAVMISASYWDVRSREVSDAHWMAIGVIARRVTTSQRMNMLLVTSTYRLSPMVL